MVVSSSGKERAARAGGLSFELFVVKESSTCYNTRPAHIHAFVLFARSRSLRCFAPFFLSLFSLVFSSGFLYFFVVFFGFSFFFVTLWFSFFFTGFLCFSFFLRDTFFFLSHFSWFLHSFALVLITFLFLFWGLFDSLLAFVGFLRFFVDFHRLLFFSTHVSFCIS